ncbi:hypothetical protein HIM_10023 [Hirsutella minnesotensis 3608]|uniref:ATPase AAA-type core domain-containing protein n=1 Tax=Hirsutella minnesotensis 3608 TaxID=1043627 RepID=A0A0F8A2P4_9HYPO|nr:hypothetical protein HIM_10023 [Hirsutella minnesotensis 3608]
MLRSRKELCRLLIVAILPVGCRPQVEGSRFVELHATSTGVSECWRFSQEAVSELVPIGRKTIVFYDEIHQFNMAQQDVLLKPVEAGTVTLIDATTENPLSSTRFH